tara:strand:- start:6 stop:215 length:210 start_codon:yes stop_codon:yes gene_type:complete
MSDIFYNLYKNSYDRQLEFAKIIGHYQGLLNIIISELKEDYPLYSKEQLIEKLKLEYEQLKEKFKEANK